MDMDLRYAFSVDGPGEQLRIVIDVSDKDGLLMQARHQARRLALTDATLLRLFVSLPALTLRVVLGILWEALKIRLKGVLPRRRPLPPSDPVTVVSSLPPFPSTSDPA